MEDYGFKVLFIGPSATARELDSLLNGSMSLFDTGDPGAALERVATLAPECVLMNYGGAGSLPLLEALVRTGAPLITLHEREDNLMTPIEHGAQDSILWGKISGKVLLRVIRTVVERHRLTAIAADALESLRESEARFRDIADRIVQGLWVRTADGERCIYLNPAFTRIWGRTLEEMNASPWGETVHPDDREKAYRCFQQNMLRRREYRQAYRIVRPDGEVRWIENHAYPVFDAEGGMVRMAGIAMDVTTQRQMEEDLRIAQKLEGLGQLAAGIAHEINTPSQYVSDNISFLKDAVEDIRPLLEDLPLLLEKLAAGAPVDELLRRMKERQEHADLSYLLDEIPAALSESKNGIEQIRKIVLAMKGFAHPGEYLVSSNLNEIVSNTLTVTRNEWKYVARMETALDDTLPLIDCVPSAIGQVVLNLIVNAAHALQDKFGDGELGLIRVGTGMEQGHACIRVEDNGPGIPDEIRERIFEPFFTTKEVGKGTGQGLALAHKIVHKEHGGRIRLESVPGQGSSFTILLPSAGSAGLRESAA